MESAKGTKLKEITLCPLDTKMDRKGAVFVRYSYSGMEIHIVPVVIIS